MIKGRPMITADLKLLVDVAWENRAGQSPYFLAEGSHAAAARLVKRGLLMRGTGRGQVGITAAGEKLVGLLSEQCGTRKGESMKAKLVKGKVHGLESAARDVADAWEDLEKHAPGFRAVMRKTPWADSLVEALDALARATTTRGRR